MGLNLREHGAGEGVESSLSGKPGHGNTWYFPRAQLLTFLGTPNLKIIALNWGQNVPVPKHIDDDVKDARDVPGDIALQAARKRALGELSLIQSKREAKGERVRLNVDWEFKKEIDR